jgi:hypothetical protein
MKTNTDTQTQLTTVKITSSFWLPLLALMLVCHAASAQTIISGPTTPGGTWSPTGNNPDYIITGDCSLIAGQTLTIQPGVVIWLGSNVTFTANGALIQAMGTPSQRITFQSASTSYNFNSILVENEAVATNRFRYCDFANAGNAINMYAVSGNQTMNVEILNCTFSNCTANAIFGHATGADQGCNCGCTTWATLIPVVKNCIFTGGGNGLGMLIDGNGDGCGYISYGYAYPIIMNNIFQNLAGAAVYLNAGSYAGGGSLVFINNTTINCRKGFWAVDPWDATVEDCLFVECTNAVYDTGTLSRLVSYNDFYGNATNFTGYQGTYGQWSIANRNGTPSDVLYNISQNPLFLATNDFHLATNSPCVNAGIPNTAYANMCVPPSAVTTNFPELGADGGPDACNWLDVVPKQAAQLSMSRSNNVLRLNWGAIPRSTYSVQYLATNFNATSGTNKWLTNSTVIPAAKPVSIVVSPYPATNNKAFYRVQSLGRTPGN